jgi:hypothetical protein
MKVYGLVDGLLRSLMAVPVESDDPDGSRRMSAAVRFLPSSATRTGFFDLQVMRRNCSNGRCSNALEFELYRYRDGEYFDVQQARVAAGRAKSK